METAAPIYWMVVLGIAVYAGLQFIRISIKNAIKKRKKRKK